MQSKDQIDASVLLELFTKPRKKADRRKIQYSIAQYFDQVERKRKNGYVSISCLGEVFNALHNIDDDILRNLVFAKINDLLSKDGFTINSPNRDTFKKADEILEFDYAIEPQDALRIAEAITNTAQLITLDNKLLSNKVLQNQFNVTIRASY